MTVLVDQSSKRFHGTGSSGPLTWTWRFLANTDILVYRIANPDEEDPTTEVRVLLGDGDYLLTGAGSYTGGSLMLGAPLVEGEDLLIKRMTSSLQKVSIRNQGNNFRAETHEDVFDRLTMMIQDREREITTNTEDIVGFKARMAAAEEAIALHGGRLDTAEVSITDHGGRIVALETSSSDHETRITDTETTSVNHEIRIGAAEAAIVALDVGMPGFLIYGRSAAAGQVFVDVAAAGDPDAKSVIVGKKDATENPVTFRPAAGFVDTSDGPAETVDIVMPGEFAIFVPDETDNTYYRVN